MTMLSGAANLRLKSFVERIERLEEDKASVASDIKEVFAEAKGEGFDVKILRKVVRLRKQDPAKRQEEDALLDLYLAAIESVGIRADLHELQRLAEADDTRITIEFPGHAPIKTTASNLAFALDEDELYRQAVEIVTRDQKASASYVQRRLQLGYNRAAGLVERMEREGVLGPPNFAGKREILRAAT